MKGASKTTFLRSTTQLAHTCASVEVNCSDYIISLPLKSLQGKLSFPNHGNCRAQNSARIS